MAYTSPYSVTVKTQPLGEQCDVANGTGTGIMPAGPVDTVQVLCTALPFMVWRNRQGLAPPGNNVVPLGQWHRSIADRVDLMVPSRSRPTVLSGSAYASPV